MRTFTYFEDIVDGIILAGQKGKGDGYPLGTEEGYNLWEVGKMFGFTTPEQFELIPPRPGDRMKSFIDLSSTYKDLSWKAKYKLKDHISNFLKEQEQADIN